MSDAAPRWRQFYETEAQQKRFQPAHDPLELSRVRLVERLWPRGVTTAFDVGCGDGFLCSEWVRRRAARRVFGADLVVERVRRARASVPAGQFSVHSAYQLGFADASFDLVAMVETLEHLEHPESALREVARLSRRYVLITVPYREDLEANQCLCPHCLKRFHPAGHLQRFDEARITALLASVGVRVVTLRIQCYLRVVEQHPLCRWWPRPLREYLAEWARRARLIQGTFLGVLGERHRR